MTAPEVPFSELQLHTKATVAKLRASRSRSLRLRRRDDEDLVLVTADRNEQDQAVLSSAARILVALARHGDPARAALTDAVREAFPWVRFLPAGEDQEFVTELVETLRAADTLHNLAPVVQVIAAWQHTAEACADPEIASVLMADQDGDFGRVPDPSSAARQPMVTD